MIKKNKILICFIWCVLLTKSIVMIDHVWSKAYYVDATNGSDLNNGTNENMPWKTIGKINDFKFLPGDKILFKRNEIWKGKLVVSCNGSLSSQLFFGAYSSGNMPKVGNIYINNKKYLTIENIDINGIAAAISAVGIFNSTNIEIIGCKISGSNFKQIWLKESNKCVVKKCFISSPENAFSRKSKTVGVEIGEYGDETKGCHDINISGNNILNLRRGIVIRDSKVGRIDGNVLHNITGPAIWITNTSNILIENNVAHDLCNYFSHNGFNIGGGIKGSTTSEITVRYNEIYNVKFIKLDGCGIFADVGLVNSKIYGNIIHDIDASGIRAYKCNNIEIFNNLIFNVGNRTDDDDQRNGISCNSAHHIKILNNTIYQPGKYGIQLIGNNKYPTHNIIIKNNIISNSKTYSFVADKYSTLNVLSDHNNWYFLYGKMALWRNNIYESLNEFVKNIKQDANSISENPLFLEPVKRNFRLRVDSPNIGKGVFVGIHRDIDEKEIFEGGPVNIGAYQN